MSELFSFAPFFALISAMFFGMSGNIIKRGFDYVDAQTATVISIFTTLFCFLIAAPFWIEWEEWSLSIILIFSLIGLMQPAFSRYLSFEANRRVGPTIASTFTAITPLIASGIAIVFLGESLTISLLLGTMTVVVGMMLISWKFPGDPATLRLALLFALGTSLIRATGTNMGKLGMTVVPSPLMGALVSFSMSLLVSLIVYYIQKGQLPRNLPRKGLFWCGLAGVILSVGVISLYSALLYGSVVTVSPILATAPIFTLVFASLFRMEAPAFRVILGVFVVVSGVIWVILNPGI